MRRTSSALFKYGRTLLDGTMVGFGGVKGECGRDWSENVEFGAADCGLLWKIGSGISAWDGSENGGSIGAVFGRV
jgi:hypothetical protein